MNHSLVLRAPALERLEVNVYDEFRCLELDAPKLRVLSIDSWSERREGMVVKVTAPRLEEFTWKVPGAPYSFQIGEIGCLQRLRIISHGKIIQPANWNHWNLLRHFPSVDHLKLRTYTAPMVHPANHVVCMYLAPSFV